MITLDSLVDNYKEFASDEELKRCIEYIENEYSRRIEELENRTNQN